MFFLIEPASSYFIMIIDKLLLLLRFLSKDSFEIVYPLEMKG